MDEKMLDLQNLLISRRSYNTLESARGSRGMSMDSIDIALKEYVKEVDRISGFYSYNVARPLHFNKVQGYDVTLDISHT